VKTKTSVGVPWLLPLVAGLLGVALTLILTFQLLPSRYELKEGEVSRDSIKSPSQVSFISQVLTKQERDRAELQVADVFREEPSIGTEQMSRAKEATGRIGSVLFSPGLTTEEKRGMLMGPPLKMTAESASSLAGLSPGAWPTLESEVLRLVEATMKLRIAPLEVAQAKAGLEGRVSSSLSSTYSPVVAQLAAGYIRSNVVLDQEATRQARTAAREAVGGLKSPPRGV